MSKIWNAIGGLVIQLLDLLVDALYLFLWTFVNWILLRGLKTLHPSTVLLVLLWTAEGIFAGFTLAIIILYLIRDFKTSEEDRGLIEVWEKLKTMARQLRALIMLSTLLIGWAAINWLFEFGVSHLGSQASVFVNVSHSIGQAAIGVITIRRSLGRMYKEIKSIHSKLFP